MAAKTRSDRLRFVTYCGLHCGLCSSRSRIPRQARALQQTMKKEGWELWGGEFPRFREFWPFLKGLTRGACPGCRAGGGPPFCGIRKCARKRRVEVCVFCRDWPCHRIKALAAGYLTLIPDAERLKRIGLGKWLKEQRARQKTGFCYCDVRCEPYDVPSD